MSVEEASGGQTQLAAELGAGIATLSLNQTVNFTLYVKLVLPLDGYIFWINSNLLQDSALFGNSMYNQILYNSLGIDLPPRVITVKGSLHWATESLQLQEQNASRNHVIFSTQEQIQDFNAISSSLLYIADFEDLRFAFNSTRNFYRQADLYHYHGDAIYSIMKSQIIDSITDFDTTRVIVSNSLPLWLTLNQFFPMYPSFLSDNNVELPYATIHIDPKTTEALQSAPLIYIDSSHYQLSKETVRIDIFGIRNNQALQFHDYVLDYSRNTDNFGLMNIPIMQDEHVTQRDFAIIAQKKTITFEISYFQQDILDIAKKLILSSLITVIPL